MDKSNNLLPKAVEYIAPAPRVGLIVEPLFVVLVLINNVIHSLSGVVPAATVWTAAVPDAVLCLNSNTFVLVSPTLNVVLAVPGSPTIKID